MEGFPNFVESICCGSFNKLSEKPFDWLWRKGEELRNATIRQIAYLAQKGFHIGRCEKMKEMSATFFLVCR